MTRANQAHYKGFTIYSTGSSHGAVWEVRRRHAMHQKGIGRLELELCKIDYPAIQDVQKAIDHLLVD